MRDIPNAAAITEWWKSEEKTGTNAPVLRATVQKQHMQLYPYNTADAPGGDYGNDRDRRGNFATFVFSGEGGPNIREIRGIKSYTSSTSVDQDTDEATLVILNTDITPIGNVSEDSEDFDDPGRFTFSRGDVTLEDNRWGHLSEGWDDFLAPDRVIKVYAGPNPDDELAPAMDPNLTIRGTWMIDTVEISTDGTITVKMRSLARLLLDHICFPPVIPWEDYPLTWSTIHAEEVRGRAPTGGDYVTPGGTTSSSNNAYVLNYGQDDWEPALEDTPRYVGRYGGVQGHSDRDALGNDTGGYWLSTGQDSRKSVVWWEIDLNGSQEVNAIKLHPLGGPYRVYVSIHNGTQWMGKKKIPYSVTTGDIDNGAGIKFVHQDLLDTGGIHEIVLPRVYNNAHRIRITMTRLRKFDGAYPWRAGLKLFKLYTGSGLGFDDTGTITKQVGNYRDWTQVVKWVSAWAGFWRPEAHAHNVIHWSNEDLVHYDFDDADPVLPKGRIWGNFQPAHTAGIADATPDNFDKQPLMDVINYVRNITGFFFRVDELGMVVWRMPNIWALGCYVHPHHLETNRGVTYDPDAPITIDETEVLIDYQTTLNSMNLRERIFVANSTGKFGTVIKGYRPYSTGLRRVAGWTDEHFSSNHECKVAADMIAARQMFDWRRAQITMPAHPAIQIDDQIRIFERVTNETFYHYVLGIEESFDCDTGVWTQQLATHWLGEDPSDAWVVRVDQLDGATQAYLNNLGTVD